MSIVSWVWGCVIVGFNGRAFEQVIQLCGKLFERFSFGLIETTIVRNHRSQNLDQLDKVDKVKRLEQVSENASVGCLARQVEAVTPACVFVAQFPDSREQRPGSDDFHRPWVTTFHARMIRDLFHFNVCHSHAFELVEKRRHGEICSSLHTCLSKRLFHFVVHPSLIEGDIDVAVDDIDRVRKRAFRKPLVRIKNQVVIKQLDEGMVSESQ